MANDKLLRIYLNDHLAASKAGAELAHRALANNEGERFEEVLQGLLDQIRSERDQLRALIDRVGGSPDVVKETAAWLAEKIGRLKPNGQLTGYSPLSRLLEFEGLCIGIEAKICGWKTLRHVAETDPRFDPSLLDELIQRGEGQREEMERLRLEAVSLALGTVLPKASTARD